jgi:hypothetical protein
MGVLAALQLAATSRPGLLILRSLQASAQKLCARLGHGHGRGMSHRGKGVRRLLCIRQKPRMCPAYGAGGGVALLDESIEQPALVVTQLHDIFLGHGFLLSGGKFTQENRQKESL